MAGQQKRQIYIRFYYTVASSMTTDPWTGSLWSTATRGIIKMQTRICNLHPGPPSGEDGQPGMLLLGVRGQKMCCWAPVHECQRSTNVNESLSSVESGKLKIRISLILIKNLPGFGLTKVILFVMRTLSTKMGHPSGCDGSQSGLVLSPRIRHHSDALMKRRLI